MLTFHNIEKKETGTTDRLKVYLKRKKNENQQRKLSK